MTHAAVLLAMSLASGVAIAEPDVLTCCKGDCVERICVRRPPADEIPGLVAMASHVFFGRVIATELVSCCERQAYITFRVVKAWKGSDIEPLVVLDGNGCTSKHSFIVGEYYLVALQGPGTRSEPAVLIPCEMSPLIGLEARQRMMALDEWQRTVSERGTPP